MTHQIIDSAKRRIAVITGTRAEYGLLRELLLIIKQSDQLLLQLVVTGMHLSPEFGLTYRHIESDGFKIDAKVEMLLSSDTAVGIAKSVGLGVIGFADAFDRLQPDMIVVLGDRFEMLAAATAAMLLKIPISHIHGGELSAGALDDSIRHSITKMSHLHFTAAKAYRERVIQLGERPENVFNVGAPGIERLKRLPLLSQQELENTLGFLLKKPLFLVTFHPETAVKENVECQCDSLFSAIERFKDATIIVTKSNADEAGRKINQYIDAYAKNHKGRIHIFDNLGDLNYLSVMKLASVIIGNSSSGIIEAPSLKIPTVNIGCRQEGRLRADSVIDCVISEDAIYCAIKKALSGKFKGVVQQCVSPYDADNASENIFNILKNTNLQHLSRKVFFNSNSY